MWPLSKRKVIFFSKKKMKRTISKTGWATFSMRNGISIVIANRQGNGTHVTFFLLIVLKTDLHLGYITNNYFFIFPARNFQYKRYVHYVVHHHLNIKVSSVKNKRIVKMKIAIICTLLAGKFKLFNFTFYL